MSSHKGALVLRNILFISKAMGCVTLFFIMLKLNYKKPICYMLVTDLCSYYCSRGNHKLYTSQASLHKCNFSQLTFL